MRKPFWLGLTTALLSCAGCFTPPAEPLIAPPAVPAPTPRAARPVRPPVTADQITTDNAQQKAQELLEEMDLEQQQALLNPPR